jgi:hypothetical protein
MPERHAHLGRFGRIELRQVGAAEDCEDARWMSEP